MIKVRSRYNETYNLHYFKILFITSILLICFLEASILASNGSIAESQYKYESLEIFQDRIVPEWVKSFGGNTGALGYSVQPTSDGGYIVAGGTRHSKYWDYDVWLIKTSGAGIEEWNRTYGDRGDDTAYSVQETSDGGFIIAGMKATIDEFYSFDIWLIKTNKIGIMEWNRTFGGNQSDKARSVQQTSDGGYIVVGNTMNYGNGGSDVWIIKTDSEGTEEWNMTYGDISDDVGYSIQETSDGGFIITGKYTIDTSGGVGVLDISRVLLLKINNTGEEQWNKTFGRTINDIGHFVQETTDGGFIIAGDSNPYGSNRIDAWLIKTNSTGGEEWNKTYGGWFQDHIYSVNQTSDGGFLLAGETDSYAEYDSDIWLIKTDENGTEQWNKTFGGDWYEDLARFACETSDGGFIITGLTTKDYPYYHYDLLLMKTNSEGTGGEINIPPKCAITSYQTSEDGWITVNGISSSTYGSIEMVEARLNNSDWFEINGTYSWTYRLNTNSMEDGNYTLYFRTYNGRLYSKERSIVVNVNNENLEGELKLPEIVQWKTFGNNDEEFCFSFQPTDDDGYIIGSGRGYFSYRYYQWYYEPWVLKLDSEFNEQWNRTYGSRYWRPVWAPSDTSIVQTSDGGYIVAEQTHDFSFNNFDIWLIKTDEYGVEQWNRTYGGSDRECAKAVQQTRDGGYIILGWSMSFGSGNFDIWLVKTDSSGKEVWNRTYGGFNHDYGYSIDQTTDGGFIITGKTFDDYEEKIWLMKVDSSGEEEWDQLFGFWGYNEGHFVKETSDGGFIITGQKRNMWEEIETSLLKTDSKGNKEWELTFDFYYYGVRYQVTETSDNGFVIVGSSYFDNNNRSYDMILIKVDAYGTEQWNWTFGGLGHDEGSIVLEKPNGNLLIAGRTTEFGPGDLDIILIELKPGDPVTRPDEPEKNNTFDDGKKDNVIDNTNERFQSDLIWFILVIIIIFILIIIAFYIRGKFTPSEPEDPRQPLQHPRT